MKSMIRFSICSVIQVMLGVLYFCQPSSAGFVTFYRNRAVFESALLSQSTINFEGLAEDNSFYNHATTQVIGGVTFTASFEDPATNGQPLLNISGKNSFLGPFNSAVLFHDGAGPITADLTTAGSGFTAVGGNFGHLVSYPAGLSTMTLMGTTGVLDVRTLDDADLRRGNSSSFFGWIVQEDTILSIRQSSTSVEAIDNFIFGVAGSVLPPDGPPDGSSGSGGVVPEPVSIVIWGIGALGMGLVARRRAIERRQVDW